MFHDTFLTGAWVRVVGNGENLMHNKFCLIDVTTNEDMRIIHPNNGLLINGSLNWTSNVNKYSFNC